jgi:hypothetical protein
MEGHGCDCRPAEVEERVENPSTRHFSLHDGTGGRPFLGYLTRALSRRTMGAVFDMLSFTLCPNRSRMLSTPYVIMVGLQGGATPSERLLEAGCSHTRRETLQVGHAEARALFMKQHSPLQGQTPRNHAHTLWDAHRGQHFRAEHTWKAQRQDRQKMGHRQEGIRGGCVH